MRCPEDREDREVWTGRWIGRESNPHSFRYGFTVSRRAPEYETSLFTPRVQRFSTGWTERAGLSSNCSPRAETDNPRTQPPTRGSWNRATGVAVFASRWRRLTVRAERAKSTLARAVAAELEATVIDGGISYNPSIPGGAANFGCTRIHSVSGGTPHDAPGKGAVACTSGTIAVWRISS